MLWIKLLLPYYLCATVNSEILRQQRDDVQAHVTIRPNSSKHNTMDVRIGVYPKWFTIFLYPNSGKSHAFYTAMSCKFADWTLYKLNGLLKLLRLFDQYRLENARIHDETLGKLYKESMVKFKADVETKIDNFIRILNNILDTHAQYLYYSDTVILKTLASLRINVHFIRYDAENIIKMLQLVFADFSALQNASAMSCFDSTFNGRKSSFNGYWTNIDESNIDDDIEVFLSSVKKIQLESNVSFQCSVGQVLLEKFVTLSSNHQISIDILNTEVVVDKRRKLSIRKFRESIEKKMNIDATFWYQDIVLTTVIKIIYWKMTNILSREINKNLMAHVFQLIEQIHGVTSKESVQLPSCLVIGFSILFKGQREDETYACGLSSGYNSLSAVDISKLPFNTTDVQIEIDYLENILHRIFINITDFKCIRQYFKCVYNEHNRYDTPFIEYMKDLYIFPTKGIRSYVSLCEIILNIYSMLYQTYMFSNLCIDSKHDSNNSNYIYCSNAWEKITFIRKYFLISVEIKEGDLNFCRLAHYVSSVLVNMNEPSERGSDDNIMFELQRVLGIVMNELNSKGLFYCPSRNSNFLLFNNMNLMDFGNGNLTRKSIENNMSIFSATFNLNHLQPSTYLSFSVNKLYKKYIFPSKVFNFYEDKIKVNWKGSLVTVKDVCEDLIGINVNPRNVYVFYEIFFKFYIAVFYYEIRQFLDKHTEGSCLMSQIIEENSIIVHRLDSECFPQKMEFIITEIISLTEETSTSKMWVRVENIDNQLKTFYFADQNEEKATYCINPIKCFMNSSNCKKKNVEEIFNELYRSVKKDVCNVLTIARKHYNLSISSNSD